MNAAMPISTRRADVSDDQWKSLLDRLRVVARAVVGPVADRDARADDLAQETMVRLLRAGRQPSEYAYARRTLVRLYLDEERSLRRQVRRRLAWMDGRATHHEDDSRLAKAEAIVAAQRALRTLSPLQRAAFTLRVIENLSYDEIAGALDASPGAARTSVHAARKRLAEALGEIWP